ncbi:hypothetical protein [Erythrobacter sp.]|uniref:hypothetical protein n=1 Tax=Erythrobacter sp. TaxID=1042 RepID=UPI001425CA8C|nr:hypothetical protein [Erythrobacter sp.]QIQ85684.1 MAG: hypothetical protein G9473_02525 [Erythrobacter sp.]
MALLAGAIPFPAMADEPSAQGATALVDGQIVYSREVRHAVGSPHFPGRSHEATTAPTGTILSTVSNGLVPLSDLETSAVTASLPRSLAVLDTGSALNGPVGAFAGQASPLIPSESASLNPGATIGSAMQSLHGALGSLSVLPGGGQ